MAKKLTSVQYFSLVGKPARPWIQLNIKEQEKVNTFHTYLLDLGPITKLPHHQLGYLIVATPNLPICVHHNFRHLPVHVLPMVELTSHSPQPTTFTNLPPTISSIHNFKVLVKGCHCGKCLCFCYSGTSSSVEYPTTAEHCPQASEK